MRVHHRGLYRLFATTTTASTAKFDPKRISDQIAKLNEDAKNRSVDRKNEKVYINKMSPERIEKIGS